jgi:tRNA-specific adenosine deaminase 2
VLTISQGRHESYYRSTVAQRIEVPGEEPIEIDAGELIHCESSYKFSERETLDTFDYAGLRVVQRWTDKAQRYDVWLVERPAVHFLSTQPTGLIKEPTLQASSWGLPTREDWTRTWKAWDIVTLTMIPSEMLHKKPIDLRRECGAAFLPSQCAELSCRQVHLLHRPYPCSECRC